MIRVGWQFIRKNRLRFSAVTDIFPFMSNAAVATNIVSLDEYRRSRGERQPMQARNQTVTRSTPATPAVWVYWVPVWVW
jgi:hypothetical protein